MRKIDKRTHLPYYEIWSALIYDAQFENARPVRIFIDEYTKHPTCWYQLVKRLGLTKDNYAIIIGENGLSGKVYRYNNYAGGEIVECGTTEGYA